MSWPSKKRVIRSIIKWRISLPLKRSWLRLKGWKHHEQNGAICDMWLYEIYDTHMRRVDEGNATKYSPCLFTLGLLSYRSWMMMMMMADMQFNLHILYQFFVCYEQAKLFFPDLKIFSHASLLAVCERWWLYCWVDLLWKGGRFDNDNDDGRRTNRNSKL